MRAGGVFRTSAGWGVCFFVLLPFTAKGEGLSPWQAEREPRIRIAASPYPNYLLHILPTDVDFGQHLYRVRIDTLGLGPSSETSRGHFYTRRGGFLDLAHIRRSIDFAGYVHYRVRECLENGAAHFSFESSDMTTYHFRFRYPGFWSKLSGAERDRIGRALALLVAEEASVDISNWREILTWFDFHNVPGMHERGSAFSYEDIPSHSVGAVVAMRALRAPGVPFDEAVTMELERELEQLEIVPKETYLRAMSLVADHWWGKKTCLKRHMDTGLDDGIVEPWLVRGLEPGREPDPKRYSAPARDYSNVAGYNCRGMIVLECEPHMPKRDRVLALLGPGVTIVRPSRDYPDMMRKVHEDVIRELGPNATRPYP